MNGCLKETSSHEASNKSVWGVALNATPHPYTQAKGVHHNK